MCTCEICVLLAALLEPLCMYLVNLSIKDASRHDAEPHIVRTSSARRPGSRLRLGPRAGFEIYRVMRFSGIKLGAGINQNW